MDGVPIKNEAWVDPKSKEKTVTVVKSTADVQRLKIEKLMKNPDKLAHIPQPKKEWKPKAAPEFVRDVMGSSAGAGSGEFHVYRHIRRREYNRQAYLNKEEKRQKLDSEYQKVREENKNAADAATAKKRAKRLRKKQNRKRNKANGKKIETKSEDAEPSVELSDENEVDEKEHSSDCEET